MALVHAIMALLVRSPLSGYDINKEFEQSVGNFWKATHQQIYRELGKMEDQSWVQAAVIAQEGRPDKKLYRLTELGYQTLTAWVAQPCDVMPVKEELLVKLFVGGLVPVPVIRQQIEQHQQMHRRTLAQYQQVEAVEFGHGQNLTPMEQFGYLVLRRGMRYEADCVAWCDEVLQVLAAMAVAEASSGGESQSGDGV